MKYKNIKDPPCWSQQQGGEERKQVRYEEVDLLLKQMNGGDRIEPSRSVGALWMLRSSPGQER